MKDIFIKKNNYEINEQIKSVLLYGDLGLLPSPKVSIIMPVYKRPDTFKEALQSALSQDYQESYEIIVVDNYDEAGDSPNLEVVKKAGANNIFYYRNLHNLGMLGNWNRGIELARAPYVTYCHDDDQLLPNCLSRLMELQKLSGNKCILSAMNIIDEKGNYVLKYNYPHRSKRFFVERDHYNYTLFDQFIASKGFGVGCLFNKECMLEIGGYDQDYYPSADYALHSCYTYYYGCVFNCIPTFNYRMANNESLNQFQKFAERDYFFRQCMIEKLTIPRWFLKRVNDALHRINTVTLSIKWGGKSKELINTIKKSDTLIVRIASYRPLLKRNRLIF